MLARSGNYVNYLNCANNARHEPDDAHAIPWAKKKEKYDADFWVANNKGGIKFIVTNKFGSDGRSMSISNPTTYIVV